MSIFSETMKKSISIYRQMLRKYLPQAERINKLQQLNLKNAQLYENDIALYHTGHTIVADIEKNLDQATYGYYAYSGVGNFATHMKAFLENYVIEGNHVIHCSQKASRALVQAIQLLTLPREKLSDEIAEKLAKCNLVIARFGSEEQRELHRTTLQNTIRRHQDQNTAFYRSVLNNFHQRLQEAEARN
jgi:Uri superfamily endonuclease